jgi:hypothetical protein
MTNVGRAKHSFSYNGARINVFHVNKGEGLEKHRHIYTHASMCNAGSCVVKVWQEDESVKEYIIDKYSQPLNLPHTKFHEIEALEDDTVFVNVFADGADQI